MAVMIAIISSFPWFMDSRHNGHAVAPHQQLRHSSGQFLALAPIEFSGKGHDKLTSDTRIDACFCKFGFIPQDVGITRPKWCICRCVSRHRIHTAAATIVVHESRSFVGDTKPRAIGSGSGS